MEAEKVKLFRTLRWKRASEIWPKSNLWLDRIKSENVAQGIIDDSYFVSVLCALSARPAFLESIFVTK